MEACMMKPAVKKKPEPPKPPPKPAERKRTDLGKLDRPNPQVPLRPSDIAKENLNQRETKEKLNKTPVVPPRAKDKLRTDGSEDTQSTPPFHVGRFHQSQKEKVPTFTSYVTVGGEKQEETEDIPAKQDPGSKQGLLKGVMKGLQLKSSAKASSEPNLDTPAQEESSEKAQSPEKNKQPKSVEPKQEKRGLGAGVFWKNLTEKSTETAQKTDSESEEDAEESEKKSREPSSGGLFSGLLKKSKKTADDTQAQENLSGKSELSASNDSLSENSSNKEKGGIFTGMFRKTQKPADAAPNDTPLPENLSSSTETLSEKDKGSFFSGILRKSPKPNEDETLQQDSQLLLPGQFDNNGVKHETTKEKGSVFSGIFKKSPKLTAAPRLQGAGLPHAELSASSDSLSESKDKGSLFSGLLKKPPKTPGEESLDKHKELSSSCDSLTDTKEKGGAFTGIFKKSLKRSESPPSEEETSDLERSDSETLKATKEKGGIFSGMFKKTPKSTEAAPVEEPPDDKLISSTENLLESKQEKGGGLFSGLLKKTPKAAAERPESPDSDVEKALSASNDDLSESNSTKEGEAAREAKLSDSCENLFDSAAPKEKKGGFAGIFKRSASIENLFDEEKGGFFSGLIKKKEDKEGVKELTASNEALSENGITKEKNIFSGIFKKSQKSAEGALSDEELNSDEAKNHLSVSVENLSESATSKEKTGGLAGIFKRSPKPAPRTIVTEDPLNQSKELFSSCDSLAETTEDQLVQLSTSHNNLLETAKEKKAGFGGLFRRTPKTLEHQDSEDVGPPEGGGLRRRRTIKKKKRVVSFRIKKTVTKPPKSSEDADKLAIIEESVELQEINPSQENSVVVQPVEMAAYPTEHNTVEAEEEPDELMEWWKTVKSWAEWNQNSNFREEDEELAVEQAADRVYMAARLFVRLFNQRGASLQHRILELVALADAADQFHKKTVTAAVGGGVASVAGSVATITGLILAPFTFGASIIVTAVGIGVATAGSITSATANITDTVHSNMDRKKLEKMIQDYQDEIKVIRECLEFVQAGMDTLQEWDFEKYSQSAAKKALNHNLKHVMKEGGRAGKALMINTDKLISTVQILGAAGGAAKAAQAISVTTGVMSALFLALDVFFLAKDSHELRKGAKTKFATKIRDVCKELQDGLLELNKVKTQLQKTMDGIEVEEYEEMQEVEVEVEEDDFESDPKKLAELELELDLMERKLDQKVDEEQKKSEEAAKGTVKVKEKSNEESLKMKESLKDKKEIGEEEKGKAESKKAKSDTESKQESKLESTKGEQKQESVKSANREAVSEEPQKGVKKEKEAENRLKAAKDKVEGKRDGVSSSKCQADMKNKEKDRSGIEPAEVKTRSAESKRGEHGEVPCHDLVKVDKETEKKSSREEKEAESAGTRRHSSRSNRERADRAQKEAESWRRREEEEERREDKEARESKRGARRESHHGQEAGGTREQASSKRKSSGGRWEEESRRESRHGSRVEGARRQFEGREVDRRHKEETEEERRRKHSGGSQRRDREVGRRGSRGRSSVLLEDGLYI